MTNTNPEPDWADAIATSLDENTERENLCLLWPAIAVALRKAKADGMREAAKIAEAHEYGDDWYRDGEKIAAALRTQANKIENPTP